jgi:hypothetical protein
MNPAPPVTRMLDVSLTRLNVRDKRSDTSRKATDRLARLKGAFRLLGWRFESEQ